MLYAGIDIHKRVFQAVVLDPETDELNESRFEPSRERLEEWAREWREKLGRRPGSAEGGLTVARQRRVRTGLRCRYTGRGYVARRRELT